MAFWKAMCLFISHTISHQKVIFIFWFLSKFKVNRTQNYSMFSITYVLSAFPSIIIHPGAKLPVPEAKATLCLPLCLSFLIYNRSNDRTCLTDTAWGWTAQGTHTQDSEQAAGSQQPLPLAITEPLQNKSTQVPVKHLSTIRAIDLIFNLSVTL